MSDDTPTMRAADNDREAIVELLTRAQAEGRLDLAEFDHRVQLAWSAQTYADLSALIADLPPDDESSSRSPHRPEQQVYQHQTYHPPAYQPPTYQHATYLPEVRQSNKAARFLFRAWVAASMINFVIWALVSVTTLEWAYPWWIWVVGPWGALILAGRMTRFGQQG
ncbi:DUF1707 domain-containing protein [Umezawaea endophytica]|uniref:DUF1707 domain-containing protein n=1 Tax=Umezawaea endophytica TaxID=1654476 RepID=A0A9X2VSZ5_9PSEU|nr:DUF1707 domain-containing protein [Umezawaea endophytica]MCS7482331.1 DUF1707 domain-containing protein [Umezawaea endophytica]